MEYRAILVHVRYVCSFLEVGDVYKLFGGNSEESSACLSNRVRDLMHGLGNESQT